ncbi:MAG: hypothetical protein B5M46_02585 [Epsilonproteobacteria bacterium 4484_20]|nr:MAG: hypothetical protein B5M46_02585 [Epsilonproteobacteria bacterium 4484_20]
MITFTPSKLHHKACGRSCDPCFPKTFSLLCWNVHKKNRTDPAFRPFLQKMMATKRLHLCIFQEAEFDGKTFSIGECAYDAAANLQLKKSFYGVLTASRTESEHAEAYLSHSQESFIGPHKSLLLSVYPLGGTGKLLVLNIHAINFRENRSYEKELEVFAQKVRSHEGPMIVAGDFNAWNRKRMEALHRLCSELSMEIVEFDNEKVKSFMGYSLDFVLYRGMECLGKEVVSDHDISDHHPLLVTFRISE